ncbi:MAG: hypothetical protein EOO85_18610, partial [Pedobacter sp.]
LSAAQISWLDPLSFQYVGRSNQNQPNTNLVEITTADVLTGYQFGVSLNAGALFTKPSLVKKAREQINVAKFTKEEYMLSLETEVKTRYYQLLQFQKTLMPLNNALLDAENNYKKMKLSFERAEATLEQFNSTSIVYNQAIQAKISAETGYLSAKASLEELTVIKIEEIK